MGSFNNIKIMKVKRALLRQFREDAVWIMCDIVRRFYSWWLKSFGRLKYWIVTTRDYHRENGKAAY